MPTYSFYQVDVFSDEPTKGNPVAVVVIEHDGPDKELVRLSDDLMQSFAKWTNLSETTFLFTRPKDLSSSEYDYDLRIWTPGGELPFAGHPTLGSCKAWLKHKGRLEDVRGSREGYYMVTQRCKIGNIQIRINRSTGELAFAAPPLIRSGPVDSDLVERVCAAMQLERTKVLDAQWVVNGPGFFAMRLASARDVLDIDYSKIGSSVGDLIWGVFGEYEPSPDPAAPRYEVRLFAPSIDVGEDPVTGSLNAGIATWLAMQAEARGRRAEDYVASQGTKLGRKGRVKVQYEYGTEGKLSNIWVGGHASICIEGRVTL